MSRTIKIRLSCHPCSLGAGVISLKMVFAEGRWLRVWVRYFSREILFEGGRGFRVAMSTPYLLHLHPWHALRVSRVRTNERAMPSDHNTHVLRSSLRLPYCHYVGVSVQSGSSRERQAGACCDRCA